MMMMMMTVMVLMMVARAVALKEYRYSADVLPSISNKNCCCLLIIGEITATAVSVLQCSAAANEASPTL
jgi:hypothetical protein